MADVRIGKTGRIAAGDEIGRCVMVVDDSESTGGFLILTSDSAGLGHGHDSWVADSAGLKRYFLDAGWRVEWLE